MSKNCKRPVFAMAAGGALDLRIPTFFPPFDCQAKALRFGVKPFEHRLSEVHQFLRILLFESTGVSTIVSVFTNTI